MSNGNTSALTRRNAAPINIQDDLEAICIGDIAEGYDNDSKTNRVVGLSRNLDIRPPYQREFVYDKPRSAKVIDSILRGLPLGLLYWADHGDGTYEVIDGQQRLISICDFIHRQGVIERNGEPLFFAGLEENEKAAFLNTPLIVHKFNGGPEEKLEWFKRINVAGLKLTEQEMRCATYHGNWVTDAKSYFVRSGNSELSGAKRLMKGRRERMEWLEQAISWAGDGEENGIERYMADHREKDSAEPLWNHFNTIRDWVDSIFERDERHMSGVDWGDLHRRFKDLNLDIPRIQDDVRILMANDDVTKKSGIYPYVFDKSDANTRELSVRQFSDRDKSTAYHRQEGLCGREDTGDGCRRPREIGKMEGDHIIPWSQGGPTTLENLQMLCRPCNAAKKDRI